jgi:hypothetical protein
MEIKVSNLFVTTSKTTHNKSDVLGVSLNNAPKQLHGALMCITMRQMAYAEKPSHVTIYPQAAVLRVFGINKRTHRANSHTTTPRAT